MEDTIQKLLLGSKRNAKAFQKITEVLADHDYEQTVKQCQDKIKSLKKRYKDVIDKSRKSGAGNESGDEKSAKDLPWFDVIRILALQHHHNPVQGLHQTLFQAMGICIALTKYVCEEHESD